MDIKKFRSPLARGGFFSDTEGGAAWRDWAGRIKTMVRELDQEYSFTSEVPMDKLSEVIPMCMENPESAIHILVYEITYEITYEESSWAFMTLLREISDRIGAGLPPALGSEGQFYVQRLQAIAWYEALVKQPSDEIEIRTNYSRCGATSNCGWGAVEFELYGNGMRVLVLDSSKQGTAVLLGREDAKYLLAELSTMSLSKDQERKAIFLGSETTDENREGLEVNPSHQGEPYMMTVEFNVVGAGWSTLSSASILQSDLASIVKDMSLMLDVEPTVPTVATGYGPKR